MDLKNYGNFLSTDALTFNTKKYHRNAYILRIQMLLAFLVCGIIVEISAWGYATVRYTMPDAEVINANYTKAQNINKQIKAVGTELRQAEDDNLKIMSFFTMVAQIKPKNIVFLSVKMDDKNIKVEGESTDLALVNKFSQDLKAEKYENARMERISQKGNLVNFTIVMDSKNANKKKTKKPSGDKQDSPAEKGSLGKGGINV